MSTETRDYAHVSDPKRSVIGNPDTQGPTCSVLLSFWIIHETKIESDQAGIPLIEYGDWIIYGRGAPWPLCHRDVVGEQNREITF